MRARQDAVGGDTTTRFNVRISQSTAATNIRTTTSTIPNTSADSTRDTSIRLGSPAVTLGFVEMAST